MRDAIEKLRAVRDSGIRTLVDPTAPGPRPLHPAHPADQRRGRPQHRRRHRCLRVPRAAELPPLQERRGDRRALRARAAGRDRRHRGPGGVHQVRRRGARSRRRHPEDPGRRRPRGTRDGRSRDGAHERERGDGNHGTRGAHESGCRRRTDRRRACGRQQRSPVPACDRRHGGDPRLRPLQHPPLQPRRRPHRDAPRAARGGVRRPHPPLARRRLLLRLHGRRPQLRRRAARLPPPLHEDPPRAARARRHRRRRSTS